MSSRASAPAYLDQLLAAHGLLGALEDRDGGVDIVDLLALLAEWGLCAGCAHCAADFDADCTVGITDLLLLLSHWG